MKITVLERNSVGEDIDISSFGDFGELVTYPVTKDEVAERIADADIVVVNKARITAEALEKAPNVKMIQEFATGYDNIDIEACKTRGIAVANVSGYSTDSVAQHTFAMALSLVEKLPWYDGYVKSGEYSGQPNFSNFEKSYDELSSMTWGIIGMGAIGQRVAKIASAFGCRVIFHSITGTSKVTEYERVSLDELLASSDILSLHCPLSDKTRHLINDETLSKMKKEAVLINVARGAVVDTSALARALDEGIIQAAGLDVYEKEPLAGDSPLLKVKYPERLIMTPHMAWGSVQARMRLVQEAYANIDAFLKGGQRNRIV
ncbi:MAG: D-2-hydroxyacid dehydrogenase [Lachnospiraceae bacterium]|nr:D-2-hydroxyacid dehydrogenase [Lachnospiraceae bacterium]